MMMDHQFLDHLMKQAHSPMRNYIVPGLTSWRISAEETDTVGSVRMFEMTRNQAAFVGPHSHRFDFHCLVLCGEVINSLWEPAREDNGDFFEETSLFYLGAPGKYEERIEGRNWYRPEPTTYKLGDTYGMEAEEIHSIQFSRGCKVLFFESPRKTERSTILQPVVNDIVVPTFKIEPWMFLTDRLK